MAINEQECEVDLNIVVTYGVKIPEVTAKIQGDVKSSIETMTGLTVKSVDIHVQGVDLEKKKEDQSVEGDSVQIPVQ